jgi:3-dehydroquinate synthase
MTDSSVGGKTAITIPLAKNIAGTFKQPEFVWINPAFLSTLPKRELKNGEAEVLKYALAFDKKFYVWLLAALQKQSLSGKDFERIIYKSCFYKASVVEKDEKDEKGIREILNLGHTLAHAIETQTKYKKFLHGEAVAIGLLFAAKLSYALGASKKDLYKDVYRLLSKADMIFDLKGLKAEPLISLMRKDKKAIGGDIRFVLLKDIGKTVCGCKVKEEILRKELRDFLMS